MDAMVFKGVSEQLVSGLRKGLIGIALVLISGTLGYRVIEQWNWLDSFYMTVITVSTVGHMEVQPLSDAGRLFTIALIFIGVGVMAYCLTRIAEFMLQRIVSNVFGRRSMMKKISQMKNHTIVCGYGRTGRRVVSELQAVDRPYVVVEANEDIARELNEAGIPHIVGDATEEETLHEANICEADSLVAALESDPDNLFLTLSASGMCADLRVIVRVNDPGSARKFQKAGAARVVSPIASGANQIAQLIIRPAVVDLVELVTQDSNIAMQVFEHRVDEQSDMLDKSLSEARVRQTLGGMVIAIKHPTGRTVFDPDPDTRLQLDDTLVVIRQTET
jgi:voltage-gated potassium channel